MTSRVHVNKRGIAAIMLAHCAGMVDLVALPVWVGTLVGLYGFDPQASGGLPTLFLLGASLASITIAPRLNQLNGRRVVVAGFGCGALLLMASALTRDYSLLVALHFVCGLAVGAALSVTHGTVGHCANPHRLFGLAGLAIGILGIVFLGVAPGMIARFGGPTLFLMLSGLMALAAVASLLFFPVAFAISETKTAAATAPLGREVWFCIVGIALLCTAQAMTLSFYERLGIARGFGVELVTLALMGYGIVAIFPSPIAALLEKRLSATVVICIGPLFQAFFAMMATHSDNYLLYALSGGGMAFTILFTHTFAFGLLARLDLSGRAVAGTPAMMMAGAAVGPFLGGTLVKLFSFEAIGIAACFIAAVQVILFNATRLRVRSKTIALPEPVE
ncbi:MFS transporter [Klebsiella sp. WP3-S18-ESBL-05]|uniref:MFS transporter n=1 Tax=Klebsiella sp. WP3-S18-ESBL-05 TaxID=2675711 RepID=UPI0015DBE72C|nr:MFS transporter [Klebsiella sp. WP3-S18-ESBL-05]BBR21670.1 MFS transporter [Klebsiella sp. WP3-S18-ESBL-05]